jgi:hypothetical protein
MALEASDRLIDIIGDSASLIDIMRKSKEISQDFRK